jgi:hypothetical protein
MEWCLVIKSNERLVLEVTCMHGSFVGAFAKLRKAAFSFVISDCPSLRPRGTTRLPLDGFSWNFVFENILKIRRENSNLVEIWQEQRALQMKT